MIVKLLKLIGNCILHPCTMYHYKELWCYLKKGYTRDDYTDMDLYLLQLMYEMCTDLFHEKQKMYDLGNQNTATVSYNPGAESAELDLTTISYAGLTPDQEELLDLIMLANKLRLDLLNDIYTPDEQSKHREEFFKLLSKIFFKLWI